MQQHLATTTPIASLSNGSIDNTPFGVTAPRASSPWAFSPAATTAVAVVLALTAVAGRLITFVTAGPTSLTHLYLLLFVSIGACAAATIARQDPARSRIGHLLAGAAQRIGAVQSLLGIVLIANVGLF